jgi:hypothetical protein
VAEVCVPVWLQVLAGGVLGIVLGVLLVGVVWWIGEVMEQEARLRRWR